MIARDAREGDEKKVATGGSGGTVRGMGADGLDMPRLRLVGDGGIARPHEPRLAAPGPTGVADHARGRSARERAIARENRSAAGLSATDARWVLAVRTAQSLERGGMLMPERRRRLLAEGQRLGLRDFDTSLIIAIVQDGARTGEGLGQNVADRVGLVRAARGHERSGSEIALLIAMSLAIAGIWLLMLVRWVG